MLFDGQDICFSNGRISTSSVSFCRPDPEYLFRSRIQSSTTIETQDLLSIPVHCYRDVVLLIHFSGSSYPQHEILARV
jgi:hypothetical protein